MTDFQNVGVRGQEGEAIGGFHDRRARLSAKPKAREQIYGPNVSENILHSIWHTGGLMWPYTPIINDNITVNYESYDPVHTNQPFMAFKSVGAKEIMCSGMFTAQNQEEAEYCIAAIHFLRTITKMFFGVGSEGEDTSQAAINARGTPPPILLFNAHGTAMFHNVPVIVTSYSIELPQDVDYVELETSLERRNRQSLIEAPELRGVIDRATSDGREINFREKEGISAWLPTRFNITVNMTVQNSPNRLRRNFNLNDFRTGRLIKRGGWV